MWQQLNEVSTRLGGIQEAQDEFRSLDLDIIRYLLLNVV